MNKIKVLRASVTRTWTHKPGEPSVYRRLPGRQWGAVVAGTVEPGDIITVTDGKSTLRQHTVSHVMWFVDSGYTICAIDAYPSEAYAKNWHQAKPPAKYRRSVERSRKRFQ